MIRRGIRLTVSTRPSRLLRFAALALVVVSLGALGQATVQRIPTGTWETVSSLGAVPAGAAWAVLPDGRIYMAGGTGADGALLADAANYDPATQRWSAAPSMRAGRTGHAAASLPDGRVLIAGGTTAEGASAAVEVFDPAGGVWASLPPMSIARSGHAAATLSDGRVLVAGGANGDAFVQTAEILDPSGTASVTVAMPTPRVGLTVTTLMDGRVLLAGGHNASGDLASADIYDPATGAIEPLAGASLNAARSGHVALLLPHNNAVLFAGGRASGTDLASAELYIPWVNRFVPVAPMAAARAGAVAAPAQVEGVAMVGGGSGLASAEGYGFATVKTDKADYAPGETVIISGSGWEPNEPVTWTLEEVSVPEGGTKDGPFEYTTAADASGNFLDATWAPDWHDVGVTFVLTLKGKKSEAQTGFTDGNVTLTGRVTDKTTGNPIAGARVECTSGCNTAQSTFTGANGNYAFSAEGKNKLTFGTNGPVSLEITASIAGYTPVKHSLANVNNGDGRTLDFELLRSIQGTRLVVAPATGTYGGTTLLSATLTAGEVGVPGKTVSFSLRGSAVGTATTGPNGAVTLEEVSLAGIDANTYANGVEAAFAGDATYSSSSSTASLTVEQAESTTTVTCGAGPFTYNGAAQTPCSATVTGPGGLDRALTVTYDHNVNAGTATATASYDGDANHLASSDSKMFAIDKASSATAVTCSAGPFTYNGAAQTPCSATVTGPGGLSETLTIAYSDNVNAGMVTASASYAGDANHLESSDSKTFTIDKAPSTTTVTGGTFEYDGQPHPATVLVAGVGTGITQNVTWLYSGSCASAPTTVEQGKSCTAKASYGGDVNHSASGGTAAITITARPASVTPAAASKTYGDPEPTLTGTLSGFLAVDNVTASYRRTVGESVAGSPYTIGATLSPAAVLANYEVTYGTAKFTITPKAASVTPAPASKTYGDPEPTLTGTLSGFLAADDVSATYTRTPGETVAGGPYTISATLSPAAVLSNYNVTYNTASFTISKALLTVTANDATKILNAPNPVFSASYAGFKSGEVLATSGVTGSPSLTTDAVTTTPVGRYPILVALGTLMASNYSFAFVPGTLTIQYATSGACLGAAGHTIQQPIDSEGTSVFKQKSTVPAKFRVCDANGVSVGLPGVVKAFQLTGVTAGTVGDYGEEVVSTTPDTMFRWSPTDQLWIFNISTKNLAPTVTYSYMITLNDGSTIPFRFGLR